MQRNSLGRKLAQGVGVSIVSFLLILTGYGWEPGGTAECRCGKKCIDSDRSGICSLCCCPIHLFAVCVSAG